MSLKFKVIKPKTLEAGIFRSQFLKAAEDMAADVHADFDDVTSEFRHNVPFSEDVKATGDTITVSVMTDDLGFKYYDQGNGGPDAVIRPVNAKALRWIDKSGEVIFRKSVHGYSGRKAVERLEQLWADKAPVYFERAMQQAARNSGFAL
jgi:hypothetical protein